MKINGVGLVMWGNVYTRRQWYFYIVLGLFSDIWNTLCTSYTLLRCVFLKSIKHSLISLLNRFYYSFLFKKKSENRLCAELESCKVRNLKFCVFYLLLPWELGSVKLGFINLSHLFSPPVIWKGWTLPLCAFPYLSVNKPLSTSVWVAMHYVQCCDCWDLSRKGLTQKY